jgi:ribosomal protein S12 methylthiotransferase accessory factor
VVTAVPPHVVLEDGTVRRLPVGWGKGLSPATAVLSAVGEAIERYAASLPDRSKIIDARAADLDGPHLDPRRFALYSSEQYARPAFPFKPYDSSLKHPWVRGRCLCTGESIWIHVAFVHLSLELRRHQLIVQGSSNGLAASTSIADAARRATLELVERDAFMCTWLTRAPGRRVILDDSLDLQLQAVVTGVERLGAIVELYLLNTSAIGTTALCLALGDGREWPGVTMALGAELNALAAIRSAILEMGQTGPHLRRFMRDKVWPVPLDERAVRDMLDHAAYFFPVERQHHFDPIRDGGRSVSLKDLETIEETSTPAACRAAITAAGLEIAVVDVTSPDVRTGPFRVARAISPDLLGISYGFGLDRLPVSRIADRSVSRMGCVHPIW